MLCSGLLETGGVIRPSYNVEHMLTCPPAIKSLLAGYVLSLQNVLVFSNGIGKWVGL